MRGFAEDCLEVYENHADDLSTNLILQEISILIFFQFYCKTEFKILRKKPGDEAFRVPFKFLRRG